jgi:hypothetical protein
VHALDWSATVTGVSASVIVLNYSLCERIKKMGSLSNFERGQFVGGRLVGASVAKTAILLGMPKVTVSKVMLAYTNHGKITSAKRTSG